MRIHVPLWKSHRNEETSRLYLRFEAYLNRPWASKGRNRDGSLKVYRKGYQLYFNVSLTHGRVDYNITYDEY